MESPATEQKWKKRSQNYTGGNAIAGGAIACMAKGGLVPPGQSFIAGDDPHGRGRQNMEVITPTPRGTHVQPITPKAARKMKKRKCGFGAGPTWTGDLSAIAQAQLGDRALQQKAFLAHRNAPAPMLAAAPMAGNLMSSVMRRRPPPPGYGNAGDGMSSGGGGSMTAGLPSLKTRFNPARRGPSMIGAA